MARSSSLLNSSWREGEVRRSQNAQTAAFVGVRNQVTPAEHLLLQFALAPFPGRDLFGYASVQAAEILVQYTKIRQQLARCLPFAGSVRAPGAVPSGATGLPESDRSPRLSRPCASVVIRCAYAVQFGAIDDLFKQIRHGHQARFSTDEARWPRAPSHSMACSSEDVRS